MSEKFSFSPAQYILKNIKNLDIAKTSKQTDIFTKILEQNSECRPPRVS